MSEQRRVNLTSVGNKSTEVNKTYQKTFRFNLTLSDPDEDSCPVFNYVSLVKNEERKLIKKRREEREKNKKPNGVVTGPFPDDNDDDVKRIAFEFEKKYGGKKHKSYAELGAGYDESDPFIDNTEARDDHLREDVETAHGGYYINSGPLELKRADVFTRADDRSSGDDSMHPSRHTTQVIEEDDDEEEDEEDNEEEQSEEETDRTENSGECRTGEMEVGDKTTADHGPPTLTLEVKKPNPVPAREERLEEEAAPRLQDVDEFVVKKKKRALSDLEESESSVKLKKAKTVKALLKERRERELPPPTLSPEEPPKKVFATSLSITEAIESVVNAGNDRTAVVDTANSRDTPNNRDTANHRDTANVAVTQHMIPQHDDNSNSSDGSHSGSGSSSNSEERDNQGDLERERMEPHYPTAAPPTLTLLPADLAPEVISLLDHIKQTAAVTSNSRKVFNPEINTSLVKLEWKTKELSCTNRNSVFAHLACWLPCTKDTLMRRAKKLFIYKEDSEIDHVICKLKATIDAAMPTLLEDYARECQRVAEEKGIKSNGAPSGDQSQAQDPAAAKLPKRRFPITDEIRGYLREIVLHKERCYRVVKPRKSTESDYVSSFILNKVRPLWPSGWIKTSTLNRECLRPIQQSGSSGRSKRGHASKEPRPNSASANGPPHPPHSARRESIGDLIAKIKTETSDMFAAEKGAAPAVELIPTIKSEPDAFSMDRLVKRHTENTVSDYNTTLSDIMKKDGVIVNRASDGNRRAPLDFSVERTSRPNCDSASVSVSVSVGTPDKSHPTAAARKEVTGNFPFSRKQRLLQVSSECGSGSGSQQQQPSWPEQSVRTTAANFKTELDFPWHTHMPDKTSSLPTAKVEPRRASEEVTTATDFFNQTIENFLAPPTTTSYSAKSKEENKRLESTSASNQSQELHDLMQEIQELNSMSRGGGGSSLAATINDTNNHEKNRSNERLQSPSGYGGGVAVSWSHQQQSQPKPSAESSTRSSLHNAFHNEFLKHLCSVTPPPPPSPQTPHSTQYSQRHSASPYDGQVSSYINELNSNVSVYRSAQVTASMNLASHTVTPSKIGHMKTHNSGISSGLPHRYMPQMDFSGNDQSQSLLGLSPPYSQPYPLANWPYQGSESESRQ